MTKQKKDNKYFDPRETNSTHKKNSWPTRNKINPLEKIATKNWAMRKNIRSTRKQIWLMRKKNNPRGHEPTKSCDPRDIRDLADSKTETNIPTYKVKGHQNFSKKF